MEMNTAYLKSTIERCYLCPRNLTKLLVLCRESAEEQADDVRPEQLHPLECG